MQNLTGFPIDLPTDDAIGAARRFAESLSEDELLQQTRSRRVPRFAYPLDQPIVFIKYGGHDLQAEGEMQMLAFHWLYQQRQRNRCHIYTPEVYRVVTIGHRTFLIMQLIQGSTVQDIINRYRQLGSVSIEAEMSPYCDLVTEGIQLLRRIPVPDDATPGPYVRETEAREAGRFIKHMLFKDQEAAIEYNSIQELEEHLNQVRAMHTISNHSVVTHTVV
jgi:hypothetical protein